MLGVCRAEQQLQLLRNAYGENNCHLVRINSARGSAAGAAGTANESLVALGAQYSDCAEISLQCHGLAPLSVSNIILIGLEWKRHLRALLPGGGAGEVETRAPPPAQLGAALSDADLQGINQFLHDFAVRSLLPALEQRVRSLNHQVRLEHATGVAVSLS